MIPVQFITHYNERFDYETSAMMALEAGCRWIQLRIKNESDDEVRLVAERLVKACREKEAVLIIDDRPALCKEVQADGVHLGKGDMPIPEARELLGHEFLIGGTANTFDDLRRLKSEGADYIGLGPFRTTKTKEKLAPLLGLEGYSSILTQAEKAGIRIPVVAIGGITPEDIPSLLREGVDGVAVSGAVLNAPDPVKAMRDFLYADENGI